MGQEYMMAPRPHHYSPRASLRSVLCIGVLYKNLPKLFFPWAKVPKFEPRSPLPQEFLRRVVGVSRAFPSSLLPVCLSCGLHSVYCFPNSRDKAKLNHHVFLWRKYSEGRMRKYVRVVELCHHTPSPPAGF